MRLLDTKHLPKATALITGLRGRAFETAATRRVLPESINELREAGLVRTLQAARSGGFEESLHVHLDVVSEIARGCGSTGWVLGVMHAHAWLMGTFGERAQDDVYAANPDARVSAVLAPRGKAVAVDGGYRVSGFWPFCSGVHHAQWLILGAMPEAGTGAQPDPLIFLLPREVVAIKDDWDVAGLAGTGSNSVTAQDVFVPAHRAISMAALQNGDAPGAGLHRTTLYYSAAVPVLAMFLCGPAIGIARNALEVFRSRLPGRVVAYTFDQKQGEAAVTHLELADAATRIDTAEMLLHGLADEVEHYAARREVMPHERRAKARMDCAFAVRLCLEAVDPLFIASGGAGLSNANPLQLASRDLHAINMHGLLTLKTNLETYGRVLAGLPANSATI